MSSAKVSNVGVLQSLWNSTLGSFYSNDTALKLLSAINVHENVRGHTLQDLTVSQAAGYMEMARFRVDGMDRAIPSQLTFLPALVYSDIFGNLSHLLLYTKRGEKKPLIGKLKVRGLDKELGELKPAGVLFNKLRESAKVFAHDRGFVTFAGISGPYWKWIAAKDGLLTTEGSPDVHNENKLYVSRPSLHLSLELTNTQLKEIMVISKKHNASSFGLEGGYGRALILKYLNDNKCVALADEENFHFAEYPLNLRDVVELFKNLYMIHGQRNIEATDEDGRLYITHANFSGDDVFKAADDLWRTKFGKESASIYSALKTGSSKVVFTRLANMAAQESVRLQLSKPSDSLAKRVESYFQATVRAKAKAIGKDGQEVVLTKSGYPKRLTKAILGDYSIGKQDAVTFYTSFSSRIKQEDRFPERTRYANGPMNMISFER